jgi:hypothetical protein
MMIPPLKTIQEAVAFWRTRREEAKARREHIRDWNEAHLEEEARQIAAQEARDVAERPQLLEAIGLLTVQLFERFQQVFPRSPNGNHWHIGYMGPADQYLYMSTDGGYTLGYDGTKPYDYTSLNNSGLRRFIGTLNERAILLDERLGEMASEIAERAK